MLESASGQQNLKKKNIYDIDNKYRSHSIRFEPLGDNLDRLLSETIGMAIIN